MSANKARQMPTPKWSHCGNGSRAKRAAAPDATDVDTKARTVAPTKELRAHCLTAGILLPTLLKDRKSTRLNSSHLVISYAVFCLKKKKKKSILTTRYSILV